MRAGTRSLAGATVAFTSFTTLLFQLTQTRILSYIFWNHVVYLTVSLALLGFGISGTLVALYASRADPFTPTVLSRLLFGFGATSFGAVALTAWFLPDLSGLPGWVSLLFCYVVYVIPFVFAGAILSIILSSSVREVGGLYAIDLLAAGLGCVLFFFLLPLLGAPILVCLLSAATLVLALMWRPPGSFGVRVPALGGAAALIGVAGVQWVDPSFVDFRPVADKEMGEFLDRERYPNARIEHTKWTPIGRIDVVGDDKSNLWDYDHPPGSYKVITQDGTAHTRLLSRRAIESIEAAVANGESRDLETVAYNMKPGAQVGIIGAGGGIDVSKALAWGAESVYAVELNPATHRFTSEVYADYSGNWVHDPRVELVKGEGRSTLRSLDRQFDLLQVIAIDTFAALDSGAYVLSENYLYTVEAFQDLFRRLAPDGVLSYYRWLFMPPRETLRLTAVACEAWKRQGVEGCDERVMVVGGDDWSISLFKNTPFTAEEVAAIEQAPQSTGKWVLHRPKIYAAEQHEEMSAAHFAGAEAEVVETARAFDGLTAAYRAGSERQFFDSYQYNVTPTTDDSPFFFEYQRLNALGLPTSDGMRLRSSGVTTTLFIIAAEATLLSLVAIFWPLWRYQRSGLRVPSSGAYSVYFAALGFGFMMIEIALAQKAVLLLGNPLYALPVVLATLLIGAGVGSSLVTRAGWDLRRVTRMPAAGFLAYVGLLIVGITPVFRTLLGLPFALRVATTVVVLAPAGILMGMFFPTGLRAVGSEGRAFIPWAWGINGCMSVYGSIAAIVVAMAASFNVTLMAGAVTYALAFVAAWRIRRREDVPPAQPPPAEVVASDALLAR